MADYGHDLEFGVFVTPAAGDPEAVLSLVGRAEDSGLDLVTFQDHPYQPRFLDTWTLLSFAAARTWRVRLAPNVLNLPLRPPSVVARAVASLDILSGGRAELGLGAGAFWDAIAAMGGPRLRPGESVEALEEAIRVIRALWDAGGGPARVDGVHHRLDGAAPGPAPLHDVAIWVGAYRPRMLSLVGRLADGWLPSAPYLEEGALAAGNAAIDEAADRAGRAPADVRRLLNLAGGPVDPDELARLAVEDGVGTFIAMADDPAAIEAFGGEVAPAVRALVARARAGAGAGAPAPAGVPPTGAPPRPGPAEPGVDPTPDDGARLSDRAPWDEASRPHRPPPAGATYTRRGRLLGRHLIDVHDMLRAELAELRDILSRVREGALGAGEARAALNAMALRQNDWTLGAFCARYCGVVAQHHGIEDDSVFPHLLRGEPDLGPVIARLTDEHHVIHDAIQDVDAALVHHLTHPGDFGRIQGAIDFLTDALLSHLSYEEHELVEPLARLGFGPGQVP